ncbi:MAG: glycosyltransferase family 1 protein [Clostridia bacterium]|nr:glycosyltransferase family 1 protein [Clostridia bacterium]
MIKILHVISGMGSGGAEAMIMNWYRNIDRSKIQFDFLLRSSENIYAQEIDQLGGNVYYMPDFPKKIVSNYVQTKAFLREHAGEYAAIHVHCNALIYTNIFSLAKKSGIKKRIIHSHSTSTKSKLFLPLHMFNKKRIYSLATDFFACSEEAGHWCFEKDFVVINNSIDVERFKFSEESRRDIRQQLDIGAQEKVLCHVGRFLPVKNHKKVIQVFEVYHQRYPDSKLLLVGTGPLLEEIKQQTVAKSLKDSVLFLGVRKDVPELLSAADGFVFPSLYEGLGLAVIEAQASGLPCVASQSLPRTTKITDSIRYVSLEDSDNIWCDTLESMQMSDRWKANEIVSESAFNICNTVAVLQKEYLKTD